MADFTNNALRVISNPGDKANSFTMTFAGTNAGISHPVAVAVDSATNVYVLNQGNGTDGTVLKFNASYFNSDSLVLLEGGPMASGLANATALALDGLTNLYVTYNTNRILCITPAGSTNRLIKAAGVALHGITVLDNGSLALTDAGNHGIWVFNPATGAASQLTGFHGADDWNGPASVAAFNHPEMIAKAGGNVLVVADRGNHKVKFVSPSGEVSRLYGVSSNYWVQGSASQDIFPGWWDGPVCSMDTWGCPEAREPFGVAVAPDGSVYTSEVYYHLIRHTTGAGFTGPQPGYLPLFNGLTGIALDSELEHVFIADTGNNAVEVVDLSLNQTTTFLQAAQGMAQPVDVVVDAVDTVYVLNQGSGANGSILQFDRFGNRLATKTSGLAWPSAMTMDSSGNFYVACRDGAIQRFDVSGQSKTLATVTGGAAAVQLAGIALFDDGTIAVSDAANHVLWQVDPMHYAVSLLTGSNGVPGSTLGGTAFARLNQPQRLARGAGRPAGPGRWRQQPPGVGGSRGLGHQRLVFHQLVGLVWPAG